MQNGRIYTKALFNDGNPQERLPRSARNDEYHQSHRRALAPLVLARSVKDIAIHTDSSSLRGASATRQSHPPPVLARNVSDTAISPAPRHCEERSDVAILPSKKGLLHPFGVRNDGSIQESRDINRSNRNSHSFWDIIVSLKKMNLFLLSQR
ncbi:hypothetical protein SAMN02745108_01377 [Fibrobacter intestinalis]|uniref:Uncharacterized protein n=1 Tax=Fibrobacter intestinalis TaxID=28122 RepID=A0A1T4MTQ4_9BACT|nr:hypothetical protein BGW94_0706 [Fibrobacter sp. NR9]SJZ70372.1 hypothetical protein SAMN02745108_01377 [Fibrobacter intestinalis]